MNYRNYSNYHNKIHDIGNTLQTTLNSATTSTRVPNSLNQYTTLSAPSASPRVFTYDPDGNLTDDGF